MTAAVALVTGASRGIGRAVALALAGAGYAVALGARDRDALARVADEITAIGGRALAVTIDVTDRSSVEAAVGRAEDELGAIGVLVNNAGVQRLGAALDYTDHDWDTVLGTNLTGAFRVAQTVARRMVATGHGGVIVNIASTAGLVAFPERIAYAASKAALIMVTRCLALELAPYAIRVNAVAPTFVDTELGRHTLDRPGNRAEIEARIPLGRLATVDDVAAAVLFLAGPSAGFVTGVVLPVDGGVSLR